MVVSSGPGEGYFLGARVVRGPDWSRGDEDGGMGMLGTVCIYDAENVTVQWDSGSEGYYKFKNQFPLRICDTAQCRITHPFIRCNVCKVWPISGLRWKCTVCDNVDLCSQCYHSDEHEMDHAFSCITVSWSGGDVSEIRARRSKGSKKQLRGILPGATVARGRDWKWGDQDGKGGGGGEVVAYEDDSGARDTVIVHWKSSDHSANYRVGRDGKVDLRLLRESPEPFGVYLDHLPVMRPVFPEVKRNYRQSDLATTNSSNSQNFVQTPPRNKATDVVLGSFMRVMNDQTTVRKLQNGHGEWSRSMASVLGHVGKVVGKTASGDVHINFGQLTFAVNAAVLMAAEREVGVYYVNDYVKVESQKNLPIQHRIDSELQQFTTERIAGAVGRVIAVLPDNRVEVTIKAQKYLLSTLTLRLVSTLPKDVLVCGDVVLVLDDCETAMTLQYGHGGWTDDMVSCLNCMARVLTVNDDDDVLVSVNGAYYLMNPVCLSKVQSADEALPLSEEEVNVANDCHCNLRKRKAKVVREDDDCNKRMNFCESEAAVSRKSMHTESASPCSSTDNNKAMQTGNTTSMNGARPNRPVERNAIQSTSTNNVLPDELSEECCSASLYETKRPLKNAPAAFYVNKLDEREQDASVDIIAEMQLKLRNCRSIMICKRCLLRSREVIFSKCGHFSCQQCFDQMQVCHICCLPFDENCIRLAE